MEACCVWPDLLDRTCSPRRVCLVDELAFARLVSQAFSSHHLTIKKQAMAPETYNTYSLKCNSRVLGRCIFSGGCRKNREKPRLQVCCLHVVRLATSVRYLRSNTNDAVQAGDQSHKAKDLGSRNVLVGLWPTGKLLSPKKTATSGCSLRLKRRGQARPVSVAQSHVYQASVNLAHYVSTFQIDE